MKSVTQAACYDTVGEPEGRDCFDTRNLMAVDTIETDTPGLTSSKDLLATKLSKGNFDTTISVTNSDCTVDPCHLDSEVEELGTFAAATTFEETDQRNTYDSAQSTKKRKTEISDSNSHIKSLTSSEAFRRAAYHSHEQYSDTPEFELGGQAPLPRRPKSR